MFGPMNHSGTCFMAPPFFHHSQLCTEGGLPRNLVMQNLGYTTTKTAEKSVERRIRWNKFEGTHLRTRSRLSYKRNPVQHWIQILVSYFIRNHSPADQEDQQTNSCPEFAPLNWRPFQFTLEFHKLILSPAFSSSARSYPVTLRTLYRRKEEEVCNCSAINASCINSDTND